jgi:ribonuclease HI
MKTGASAGLLFISPLGEHVRYVLRLHFPVSNNVAEYEALVNGLRIAVDLGVRRLDCWRLVLKCYELRTRQHKVLNVNVLRP